MDVSSVPRGNKCGCICPSCNTPLIARQGEQNEWHFAHRSKNVQAETKRVCEYSFAVSVRLMMHQLAKGKLKFRIPKYSISVEATSERSYKHNRIEMLVTKERLLILTEPEVDVKFSGTNVDILGYIDNIPFAVYITHKDRLVPLEVDPPKIEKCGVVAINIGTLPTLFEKEREGRYIEVLRKFIEESAEGKRWIYHPRAAKVQKQAEARLKQWLSQQKAIRTTKRTKPNIDISFPTHQTKSEAHMPAEQKILNYRCIMCNASWRGISPRCKKCDTHLYAKVIDRITGET